MQMKTIFFNIWVLLRIEEFVFTLATHALYLTLYDYVIFICHSKYLERSCNLIEKKSNCTILIKNYVYFIMYTYILPTASKGQWW